MQANSDLLNTKVRWDEGGLAHAEMEVQVVELAEEVNKVLSHALEQLPIALPDCILPYQAVTAAG